MRKLCVLCVCSCAQPRSAPALAQNPLPPPRPPGPSTTTPMFGRSSRRTAIPAMDRKHSSRACGSTCGRPALRGGDYGPVITPGNSADSKLIKRLVHGDGGLQMPPTGAVVG